MNACYITSSSFQAKAMFDEAATEVEKQLMKTSPGGLTYFVEQKYGRVEHKMDHLACFTGKKCYAPGRSS
jgi:hypothetical protein